MKVDLTGYKGDPNDCYARALPDEPLFTLLARDPQAPALVRKWATDREASSNTPAVWKPVEGDGPYSNEGVKYDWVHDPNPDADMIAHARYLAARMEVWRYENDGKWRQPQEATPIVGPNDGALPPDDFRYIPGTGVRMTAQEILEAELEDARGRANRDIVGRM